MLVTNPDQPQVWLSSFSPILPVGCLREASVGIRFSQNTKQIAVVGLCWHGGLPARLYAGGFSLTHEHLSRGAPLYGLAGCTRQACFLRGPFQDWAFGGRVGQEGLAPLWVSLPAFLSAVQQRAHGGAECNRVSNDSVFTGLRWR